MTILDTVMKVITFFEELFNKKYGIRALYFTVLLIPSVSILALYSSALTANAALEEQLAIERENTQNCIEQKDSLKIQIRAEVLAEFQNTLLLIDNFKSIISKDNSKLKNKADKIEEEIDNLKHHEKH